MAVSPIPFPCWTGLGDWGSPGHARAERHSPITLNRGRLRRRIPADLDRRRHGRVRELVEAPGGRALLPQAESGVREGSLDLADARKLEHLESKIVRRACAGEKLPEHAMLGLVPAQLGGVARERRFPRGGKDRDAE